MELRTDVLISRDPEAVWSYFSKAQHWSEWWGGALEAVEPGWQEGARLVWRTGGASTVLAVTPGAMLEIENAWSISKWTFAAESGGATRVTYQAVFIKGAHMEAGHWRQEYGPALAKLKENLERTAPATSSSGTVTSTASVGSPPTGPSVPSLWDRLFGKRSGPSTGTSTKSQFERYSGEGVCDVCGQRVVAGEAYLIPNDTFYASKQYREWLKKSPIVQMGVTMAGSVDAFIAHTRSMDATTRSAVCPNCVKMFP